MKGGVEGDIKQCSWSLKDRLEGWLVMVLITRVWKGCQHSIVAAVEQWVRPGELSTTGSPRSEKVSRFGKK